MAIKCLLLWFRIGINGEDLFVDNYVTISDNSFGHCFLECSLPQLYPLGNILRRPFLTQTP